MANFQKIYDHTMQISDDVQILIRANATPIKNELTQLGAELTKLQENQKKLDKGSEAWDNNAKAIKAMKLQIEETGKSMDVTGMSVKQLEQEQKRLNQQFREFGTGGERLHEVNTRLAEVKGSVRAVSTEVNQSQGMWSNLKGWITTAFGVGAIIQAGLLLKDFFVNGVNNFMEFEKAASSLKGETGMTVDALEKLKDTAMKTGNQFGMTGKEMLEGYNAIASGKSELLAVEGGLQKVTEAAAKLAIDGEMSMKDAANSVTESLNQFGEGAESAEKFVNQLATGTIVGAGKVGEMSEALKKAGPIANAMGMSFGQTNAVLQLFHQNGIKGAEAGTQFKSMMAALLKGADDTNPSIVGLEKAFENLRKKNLSTTETMKLFGSEAVTGGIILTNNTSTLKSWSEKIEKGAEGADMFAAKTADVSFQLKQKQKHLVDVGVQLASNLAPALRLVIGAFGLLIDGLAGTVKLLAEIPRFIIENKALFAGLTMALIALNTANITAAATAIAHAAAERGRAIATGAMTLAQRALNLAMTANPIGLVITALSILAGVLVNAYNKSIEFRATINGLWAALKEFGKAFIDFHIGLATFNPKKMLDAFSGLGGKMSKAYNDSYDKETTAFRNAEEDKSNKRKLKEMADAKAAAKAKAEAENTERALGNLKGHEAKKLKKLLTKSLKTSEKPVKKAVILSKK
jgi:TP901 family phage tail tape measure protein